MEDYLFLGDSIVYWLDAMETYIIKNCIEKMWTSELIERYNDLNDRYISLRDRWNMLSGIGGVNNTLIRIKNEAITINNEANTLISDISELKKNFLCTGFNTTLNNMEKDYMLSKTDYSWNGTLDDKRDPEKLKTYYEQVVTQYITDSDKLNDFADKILKA